MGKKDKDLKSKKGLKAKNSKKVKKQKINKEADNARMFDATDKRIASFKKDVNGMLKDAYELSLLTQNTTKDFITPNMIRAVLTDGTKGYDNSDWIRSIEAAYKKNLPSKQSSDDVVFRKQPRRTFKIAKEDFKEAKKKVKTSRVVGKLEDLANLPFDMFVKSFDNNFEVIKEFAKRNRFEIDYTLVAEKFTKKLHKAIIKRVNGK